MSLPRGWVKREGLVERPKSLGLRCCWEDLGDPQCSGVGRWAYETNLGYVLCRIHALAVSWIQTAGPLVAQKVDFVQDPEDESLFSIETQLEPVDYVPDAAMVTGLVDRAGTQIRVGDSIELVASHDGAVIRATVVFRDGVVTVDQGHAVQVRNPDRWDMQHDWVESRWWGDSPGLAARALTVLQYGAGNRTRSADGSCIINCLVIQK